METTSARSSARTLLDSVSPSSSRNRSNSVASSACKSESRVRVPVASRRLAAAICLASATAASASSAFSLDRSMTSFGRPRRTYRPELRRRGEMRSGGASSQLVLAGTGRASRCSIVSASTTRWRAGARANAARHRRCAAASSGASANHTARLRKSALRSLRPERRSCSSITVSSRAGIEARAC